MLSEEEYKLLLENATVDLDHHKRRVLALTKIVEGYKLILSESNTSYNPQSSFLGRGQSVINELDGVDLPDAHLGMTQKEIILSIFKTNPTKKINAPTVKKILLHLKGEGKFKTISKDLIFISNRECAELHRKGHLERHKNHKTNKVVYWLKTDRV